MPSSQSDVEETEAKHSSPSTSNATLSPPTSPPSQLVAISPATSPLRLGNSPATSTSLSSEDSRPSSPLSCPSKRPKYSDAQQASRTTLRRRRTVEGLSQACKQKPDEDNDHSVVSQDRGGSDELSFDPMNCGSSSVTNSVESSSDENYDYEGMDFMTDHDDVGGRGLNLNISDSSIVSNSSSSSPGMSDADISDSSIVSDAEDCQFLYSGGNKTTDEAVLAILELYLKHRWTKQSLQGTLTTFKSLLPKPNDLPASIYLLFKYVEHIATPCVEQDYYYCSQCLKSKISPHLECQNCRSTSTGTFYLLPIAAQIKYLFEQRDLATVIDNYRSKCASDNFIKDISDGSELQRVKAHCNGMYNITILWNTDGVSVSRSSKADLWPVLGVICEVPPTLRSSFMIVCSIWCDHKHPKMNMFLRPFVDSLKEINDMGGVMWTHPKSHLVYKSQIAAPVCCADAPARASVQCRKNFNSKYGCNNCEQKTVKVYRTPEDVLQGKKRVRRCLFQEEMARLRSGERMDWQGESADQDGKSKKGVTGNAVVSEIPFLDRGTFVYPEYMHCVLLGVVELLITLWFFVKGPWYIGKNIKSVDNFLEESVKVPDHISRCPRAISRMKYWKASEHRSWLLYFSLPAVRNYLPTVYLQHWQLLVGAVNCLLTEKISQADLNAADAMLRIFVRDIGVLYRQYDYTYNVHMLLHLTLSVKRWGPLWATSAFTFENFNGTLRGLIHGTNNKGNPDGLFRPLSEMPTSRCQSDLLPTSGVYPDVSNPETPRARSKHRKDLRSVVNASKSPRVVSEDNMRDRSATGPRMTWGKCHYTTL